MTIALPRTYTATQVATVPQARELAVSPAGDLYVGTTGRDVYIIRRAQAAHPQSARVYVSFDDAPAAGVAYGNGFLYVGTQHGVWRVRSGRPEKLAAVRTGNPSPNSDGDVHTTTSVAIDGSTIYASVGSSCNSCVETDPTRATIGKVVGGRYVPIARRIRDAVALAVEPITHHLWAADVGQDELPPGHPYEFFDDVSARARPVDYGWPFCYENRKQKPGTHENCASVSVPQVVFPAYESPIGAVFAQNGAFVTFHGSWHGPAQGLPGFLPPRVVFVPMKSGKPLHAPDWNDPSTQWTEFIGGYQEGASSSRSGRPTGITAARNADLFLADDRTGAIYRIHRKRSR
jgi:glucose/arabinose dehydrogenase